MKEFDIRWVVVPALTIATIGFSDASLWIIALAVVSGFRIYIRI